MNFLRLLVSLAAAVALLASLTSSEPQRFLLGAAVGALAVTKGVYISRAIHRNRAYQNYHSYQHGYNNGYYAGSHNGYYSYGRKRRSPSPDASASASDLMAEALRADSADCLKKFVCLANADEAGFAQTEVLSSLRDAFRPASASDLDPASPFVRLALASLIGSEGGGSERCASEFARCPLGLQELSEEIVRGAEEFREGENSVNGQ